ncbi:outer membrane protein, multidrug efflux system [Roseateles sp. YR242]|uniref:efflux transporter outer membrane subunit n=1 Tax=Roseateles sp. YR242 TaxID=1855305 RepID=UPI0008D37044|nr:efflux transporter outer membrane subunit [Roseateles sp. YR242]SEK66848.1 outer membrane protein, multidrug efflux system [Roseateles sp. YR242]
MIKNRLTVLAAAVAAVALTGCINLAPDHQRPEAPVAGQWPQGPGAEAPGAQAATQLQWQQFFNDARLRELISLALKNNRDMRVALLNVEVARAQAGVAEANRWPTINAGLSASRGPETTSSGDIKVISTYQAGLQINAYELDLFSRLKNTSEASFASYLATAEAARTARIALVASVATSYLAVQADDELLKLTEQTLATREDSLKLTQLKFDNGASSNLDLSTAKSSYEAARATLAQLQRTRMQDINALTLLVGQTLPGDLAASQPLSSQTMGALLAGLPSEVLIQRPDVRQAEQQLVAAEANIGVARSAFFPSITLTTSAGTASNALSDLFKRSAWNIAGSALMPIFDFGKNRNNLDAAKANREIAVANYEKAVQTAFKEVSDALAGRATLDEQLRAQDAQAEAEATRLQLVELSYRNGAASNLDLLDAQRSSFAAQQSALQVRLAQLQNQVQLYKVLGGGTEPVQTAQAAQQP